MRLELLIKPNEEDERRANEEIAATEERSEIDTHVVSQIYYTSILCFTYSQRENETKNNDLWT